MSSSNHVHVVEDDESMRRSTSFALRTTGHTVSTWASGVAFLKEVRHADRGCILLDIHMPGIDGMQVQQILAERGVTMPIIMVTGHGDVATAVRALKAGAVDFLEKPFEKAALLAAVDLALGRVAREEAAAMRAAEASIVLRGLTARERDVLEGLAQGLPNKTIAYELGISPRTIEVHRANLMAKLDVRSLSDALRLAFAAGMGQDPRSLV